MGYRMTYLRIRSGYCSGWQNDAEQEAFKAESRQIFQDLGWTLHAGNNGVCDTVMKGNQELYLHPLNFSGIMDEDNIEALREHLTKAQTFKCYHCDCYEEYLDMSHEKYRATLEPKRGEITDYILEQYKTKRTNLYVTSSVALRVAQHFEILRLCDKNRQNNVANRYVSELIEQLVLDGQLIAAETDYGIGLRTATEKELKDNHQPTEQIDGQMTMTFY